MTTEMQDIAITEEKPLLPGQPNPAKVSECTHTHVCIYTGPPTLCHTHMLATSTLTRAHITYITPHPASSYIHAVIPYLHMPHTCIYCILCVYVYVCSC